MAKPRMTREDLVVARRSRSVHTELAEQEDVAFVYVVTEYDGKTFPNVIVSGPIYDVKDYYEGRITIQELEDRWHSKLERHGKTKAR